MNCEQTECDNAATHRVLWPEYKPVSVCKRHAEVAEDMAKSMGVSITIEEIHNDAPVVGETF